MKEEERRLLASEIAKEYQKTIENFLTKKLQELKEADEKEKQKLVETIKSIKIEPKLIELPEVRIPEIKVPEIKIPEIKIPKPEVKVQAPKIEMPEIPKTIEVKGFASFIKAVFEILKQKTKVMIEGVDRDNPLPVILVDENGKYYKPITQIVGEMGGAKMVHYDIYSKEIAVSASGDNIIIPEVAGKKIKVLSYFLVAGGTVDVKWKSGTTDITGAMAFVANTGIGSPVASPPEFLLQTKDGESLILNLSSAIAVGGHLTYFIE